MHIKVYFGDKVVFLCDDIDNEIKEILRHPNAIIVDEISEPAIKSLLNEIKKTEFHAGVLLNNDLAELKRVFFKHFKLIEAAGGIVQNTKKELLFIYRLNKWDLPKGKMEKGEKSDACALREVEEETGVTGLKLKKKVGETYHTYDEFGKNILKTTHWYYMVCRAVQKLVVQTEEDITEAKWISRNNIKEPVANTYPSIKDILSKFFDTF